MAAGAGQTVAGNLRFGLAALRLEGAEIERRVRWAAQLLQIGKLLDRKPAQLSGGQRQRVAIVRNAAVLLFDEPLPNLDAKLRTEMRLEIKKLHGRLGLTIVYVPHDQIEAPDEIYERPANLFVARFIGSPAMNTFEVKLHLEGGGVTGLHEPTGVGTGLSGHPIATRPEEGQPVVVGLRPEQFAVNATRRPDDCAGFDLPVRCTERTGSDATAVLEAGGRLVAVRIDPEDLGHVRVGEVVSLGVPGGRINLFDVRSGRRM